MVPQPRDAVLRARYMRSLNLAHSRKAGHSVGPVRKATSTIQLGLKCRLANARP